MKRIVQIAIAAAVFTVLIAAYVWTLSKLAGVRGHCDARPGWHADMQGCR